MWPNSSLSTSVSTSAEQLQMANSCGATGLKRWRAWATSSLPVPVAPLTGTGFEVGRDPPDE